jgi:hypothetical protein
MAVDLAADREKRVWTDAARDLRLGLFDFAEEERFDGDAGEAASEYWNGLYTNETLPLMSASESERFFDWFVFDYIRPSTGGRLVELYLDENWDGMSPAQRELLDRWIATRPMSGYELVGFNRQTLHLKEILSGETLDLYEPAGPGNAPIGAIILGRPVPVQDQLEFFSMPAYIPPEEIGELPDKLAAARKEEAALSDDDFLRRRNVLLIHHALDQAQRAGRPPVARLDLRHTSEGVRQRAQHERIRIKGPSGVTENAPNTVKAHRKAI